MCLIFKLVPLILKSLVPRLLELFSQRMVYVIMITLTTVVVTSVYNLGVYFVYVSKHPFFEQYRAHPEVQF